MYGWRRPVAVPRLRWAWIMSLSSLGMMLGKWQGRTVDGMEMVGQAVSGSMTWRLIPRASEAPVIHLVTNEEKDEQANT